MNHPWGISGPEFLWLYAAGLAGAVVWVVVVRARARRPEPTPGPAVSLDELAFLAGGARRLVELSIARLVAAGRLRVNRTGTLTSTVKRPPGEPLDAAVHAALGRRPLRPATLIPKVDAASTPNGSPPR